MMKFSKYSIPLIAASLVLTARTQDTTTQPQQDASGAPGGSQRQSQESQRRDRQQQLTEQQRNQQSTFRPGQVTDSELKKSVTEVNKASSFIGMNVKNMQNENLGKVHDLVFDPQKGKISYAVLSIGGVLGVGDKLIAVPVTSLRPQPGQNFLVLNMDKNQVQTAPGLAQNNWPDLDWQGVGSAAGSETSAEESDSSGAPAESSSSSDQSSSSSSSSEEKSSAASSSSSSQGSSPSSVSGQSESSIQEKSSSDSSTRSPGATDSQGSSPGGTSGSSSSSPSSVGSNSDSSQAISPDTERESNPPDSSKDQ